MVSAIEKARASARKAVESRYDGVCTIIEHQKVPKANKSTGFDDVIVKLKTCLADYPSKQKRIRIKTKLLLLFHRL